MTIREISHQWMGLGDWPQTHTPRICHALCIYDNRPKGRYAADRSLFWFVDPRFLNERYQSHASELYQPQTALHCEFPRLSSCACRFDSGYNIIWRLFMVDPISRPEGPTVGRSSNVRHRYRMIIIITCGPQHI